MVRINQVYTKTGDQGTTGLVGGERVAKDAARIEAYGTVDELNATLGLCLAAVSGVGEAANLVPILLRVQNELFNLGAELATPDPARTVSQPVVGESHVVALEEDIDALNQDLPALKSFVLPGGSELAARFHLARTVCRRAERRTVTLAAREPTVSASHAVKYLNRLSDALFVCSRWVLVRQELPERLWVP